MYPENRNTVLGAGHLYFDEQRAGVPRGEKYIANTAKLELLVTPGGNVKDYDADGEIATLNLDIDTQIDRSLSFTTKHISPDALRLFFGGTAASAGDGADSFTDQEINGGAGCYKGYWYQLGADDWLGGARNVSDVELRTVEATPVTLVADTDYILDATNGRFYLMPTGTGLVNGDILEADFTTDEAAHTALSISTPTMKRFRGALRFVSDNTAGKNMQMYVPEVLLSPSGPFALKSRESVQELGFSARIQQPETGAAIIFTYE